MIIKTKDLVDLFANDKQKEIFKKNGKLQTETKKYLLNNLKNEYKVVNQIGRGLFEIKDKINGTSIIPNNKITHDIYGNLIPAILINVKEFHDNNKVFCLSLNGVYSIFNMIHKHNYINMKNRPKTTSDLLDLSYENVKEFFDIIHKHLKYYLDNSITILEGMGLIRCRKIPYLKEINISSEHISEDNVIVISEKNEIYRRATKEEEQFKVDMEKILEEKFNIINEKEKFFGEKAKEYTQYRNKLLLSKNIEFFYECYELICLKKDEINEIVNFHNINNKEKLSDDFTKNFINLVIENANSRQRKAIESNKENFYRVSKKYLEDFTTLSNHALDYRATTIYIPKHKVVYEENNSSCKITTSKTD
jgi:hypothetical protein